MRGTGSCLLCLSMLFSPLEPLRLIFLSSLSYCYGVSCALLWMLGVPQRWNSYLLLIFRCLGAAPSFLALNLILIFGGRPSQEFLVMTIMYVGDDGHAVLEDQSAGVVGAFLIGLWSAPNDREFVSITNCLNSQLARLCTASLPKPHLKPLQLHNDIFSSSLHSKHDELHLEMGDPCTWRF